MRRRLLIVKERANISLKHSTEPHVSNSEQPLFTGVDEKMEGGAPSSDEPTSVCKSLVSFYVAAFARYCQRPSLSPTLIGKPGSNREVNEVRTERELQ